MRLTSPFHEGECAVQRLAGEQSIAERNGPMLQQTIPSGALQFLEQQNMAVLASQSPDQSMWCSIVFGRPGFAQSLDGTLVSIDLAEVVQELNDPLWSNIRAGSPVGMLVIDPVTRRRLRINGALSGLSEGTLQLTVKEAYPNCGKYITSRRILLETLSSSGLAGERGLELGSSQIATVLAADLSFVASSHPERGADASHRGGLPGFLTMVDQNTIRIPDYPGNSMFNTLGNLQVNPRAGMAIPDFERRCTLQLTGKAELKWDVHNSAGCTGSSDRSWDFQVERWAETPKPLGIATEFIGYSPVNLPVSLSVPSSRRAL